MLHAHADMQGTHTTLSWLHVKTCQEYLGLEAKEVMRLGSDKIHVVMHQPIYCTIDQSYAICYF